MWCIELWPHTPQWNPILWFLHTFYQKSFHVSCWHYRPPPRHWRPIQQDILYPLLYSIFPILISFMICLPAQLFANFAQFKCIIISGDIISASSHLEPVSKANSPSSSSTSGQYVFLIIVDTFHVIGLCEINFTVWSLTDILQLKTHNYIIF